MIITIIDNRQVERLIEFAKTLPATGKIYEVKISERRTSRSLAQNKILHAWMMQISQQYAESRGKFYPAEYWKIYLKKLFLGSKVIETPEGIMEIPISTKDLNVKEFAALLDSIDNYAGSELNIMLERDEDYALAVYGRKAK